MTTENNIENIKSLASAPQEAQYSSIKKNK